MFQSGSNFYERVKPQPDGRTFNERELQAVNRVASRISSYRDLAAAIINAKDGDTLTISEAFEVPETIPIKKNSLTVTCVGNGGLMPSTAGLTLFDVDGAVDCLFTGVKALKNPKNIEWETFMSLVFKASQRDTLIHDCHVESGNFIVASGGLTAAELNSTNYELFLGNRTYIMNNVHRSISSTNAFLDGNLNMAGICNNETNGYIQFTGVGSFVVGNMVLGTVEVGGVPHSIHIGSTEQNMVVSNIYQSGAPPLVLNPGIGNIVANNLAIA